MIKIDTREPKGEFASEFVALDCTDFTRGTCYHGADFVLEQPGRQIGVQRKEISDFINSLDELGETMRDLRANYDVGVLLLEGPDDSRVPGYYQLGGSMVMLPRGGSFTQTVPVSVLHSWQFSQTLRGSPVLWAHDLSESARVLVNIHEYHGPVLPEPDGQGSQMGMLVQLPGVGQQTAAKILDTYGSVMSAIRHAEHWQDDIEGIGQKTQQDIMATLRGGQNGQ